MHYVTDDMGNIFNDFRQIFTAGKLEQTPGWYQSVTKGVTTAAEFMQKAPMTQQVIEKGQQAVATQSSIEYWIKNPLTIAAGVLIALLLFRSR